MLRFIVVSIGMLIHLYAHQNTPYSIPLTHIPMPKSVQQNDFFPHNSGMAHITSLGKAIHENLLNHDQDRALQNAFDMISLLCSGQKYPFDTVQNTNAEDPLNPQMTPLALNHAHTFDIRETQPNRDEWEAALWGIGQAVRVNNIYKSIEKLWHHIQTHSQSDVIQAQTQGIMTLFFSSYKALYSKDTEDTPRFLGSLNINIDRPTLTKHLSRKFDSTGQPSQEGTYVSFSQKIGVTHDLDDVAPKIAPVSLPETHSLHTPPDYPGQRVHYMNGLPYPVRSIDDTSSSNITYKTIAGSVALQSGGTYIQNNRIMVTLSEIGGVQGIAVYKTGPYLNEVGVYGKKYYTKNPYTIGRVDGVSFNQIKAKMENNAIWVSSDAGAHYSKVLSWSS